MLDHLGQTPIDRKPGIIRSSDPATLIFSGTLGSQLVRSGDWDSTALPTQPDASRLPAPSLSAPAKSLKPRRFQYWVQRLVFVMLPTTVIAMVGAAAVWGENGLVERHRLEAELVQANAELATLERENQRLLRQLKVGAEDPIAVERLVAEELGWGTPSATLYRFEDDGRQR